MKVLVAEDSLDSRQLIEDILDSMGYEVIITVDGQSALDAAYAEKPDLIILDVNMPVMTGFDVCARLKADEDMAGIPVLMVTALGDIEDRVKGLGLGADDYLVKPISPRELIARIDTRLRAKQETDRLRETQQQIRRTFERFVAAEVVQQLLADPTHVALGGRLQEVTVLFADLEGFTPLSERLDPKVVLTVLNRYLELIVDKLKAHGGTIDKYMGDCVMALFNTPLPQPDHALRAVTAAMSIRNSMQSFYTELDENFHLAVNFGIHTGNAVVGNIGTADFMDFTAIGDTINTASRIQHISHGGQTIVSRTTYEQVSACVEAVARGPHQVKGREEPVDIYEIVKLVVS
jgi:class 3 adenylate cyclase